MVALVEAAVLAGLSLGGVATGASTVVVVETIAHAEVLAEKVFVS